MLLYKIEAQEINGRCHVWPFGEERWSAERTMENLSSEDAPKTAWAELSSCSDVTDDMEWDVEYGFEREVKDVAGRRVFTGRIIWY